MDAMPETTRERLKTVRNGLLRLHKQLLDSEKAAYEKDVAKISTTGQYLDLVLNDPWFAWLRELLQFIVMVDEALSPKDPAPESALARLLGQARALLVPAAYGPEFGRKYWEAMQRDAGIVLAHGEMLRAFE